ncbi:uncharacterized protein SCHCODRAFT_02620534 [Schizophyllum commune H4-8]|uniref:uncharacterized protein n=1 Tax=Schizophyllum commune (strain H4-8 / FGSC 9210) TaxID=578458 RepID=UPI00215FA7E5|nr:uncharacterized protein SCHCODRAFT_02620534 [Schizophyllum commune H4-8]KAI5895898.1 hypothetical protein SCHCODRAFT_02620534 [Schizophyllum commune H4-8]
MVSRAVRAIFFALSLSGLFGCWFVLIAWGRAIKAEWAALTYLLGLTLCQGVFCLGMIWEMDPYYMPWVLCVAQPIVIAFSTFVMTGLVTTFSCSTFIFITKGGRTTPLQWHPLFLLPLVAFPVAATIVQATVVMKLGAVTLEDGLQCDANDPLWTRFLSYAGAPYILTIPCIAFSAASVVRIRATDRKARVSRTLVASDAGLTSPVHSIPLPSPVSPVSVRPSTSSRYSRPPNNRSCSFASLNCANPPAIPPSPDRPPPLPPISAYAEAIQSPTSATRLVGATYSAGRRRSVSFSGPASAAHATSSWAKDDVSIVSEEVPLDKQSPYDEELWVGADHHEEVLPVAQPCYLPGNGSVRRAFSTESEEFDDDNQSVESASVFPVRSAGTDASTVRTSCDRTTETDGATSTQPESSVRAASLKLSRRPRRLSLPVSLQSRRSASASQFRGAIWRIVFFQFTFIAVQILSSVTTVIDIATGRPTPTPVGTHHAALLLAAWGPIFVFGSSPAVRRRQF